MFDNFPLWPARASTTAGNVDALYIFLVVLSTFMSVAIFVMILAFAAKYRRRPGHAAEQIEGSTILEITWSVIPFGIFVVIFVWGAVIFFQERTPPRGATEIYVVAKQWMWKLELARAWVNTGPRCSTVSGSCPENAGYRLGTTRTSHWPAGPYVSSAGGVDSS